MHKRSLLAIVVLLFAFSACKKGDSDSGTTVTTSVTINGTDYPVVTIGNQLWTSVNYRGAGGYADPARDVTVYGKYYTVAEAPKISLPAGWRLPTQIDFETLVQSFTTDQLLSGGFYDEPKSFQALAATTDWTLPGTNSSKFNLLPASNATLTTGTGVVAFKSTDKTLATLITSTHTNTGGTDNCYIFQASTNPANLFPVPGCTIADWLYSDNSAKVYLHSIRFVKDK